MTRTAPSSAGFAPALEAWCAAGATGALRVPGNSGGTVYLTGGRVSYAECRLSCRLDRMLTVPGRVEGEAWRQALAAGRAGNRVGAVLVERHLLSASEVRLLVLTALYGALHFLLAEPAGDTGRSGDTQPCFEVDATHPIGAVVALELSDVRAEVDRRRRTLVEAHPDPTVDDHAVVPVRRLPGHLVALTALQWEIVVHADHRRTPVDLSRSLGRDTYATLLESRRLAATGLIRPGRPAPARAPVPQPRRPATGRTGTAPAPSPVAPAPPPHRAGHRSAWPETAATGPEPAPADGSPAPPGPHEGGGGPRVGERPPGLPRRPATATPDEPDPAAGPYTDGVLLRIRDALRALR